MRVTCFGIESIVLVVVLVLVLEKAECACKIRWGDEDEHEYKDEYESRTTYAGCVLRVTRFRISECKNMMIRNRVASYGLRVTGCELRVAGVTD